MIVRFPDAFFFMALDVVISGVMHGLELLLIRYAVTCMQPGQLVADSNF